MRSALCSALPRDSDISEGLIPDGNHGALAIRSRGQFRQSIVTTETVPQELARTGFAQGTFVAHRRTTSVVEQNRVVICTNPLFTQRDGLRILFTRTYKHDRCSGRHYI